MLDIGFRLGNISTTKEEELHLSEQNKPFTYRTPSLSAWEQEEGQQEKSLSKRSFKQGASKQHRIGWSTDPIGTKLCATRKPSAY
jgi:hypothetical protein